MATNDTKPQTPAAEKPVENREVIDLKEKLAGAEAKVAELATQLNEAKTTKAEDDKKIADLATQLESTLESLEDETEAREAVEAELEKAKDVTPTSGVNKKEVKKDYEAGMSYYVLAKKHYGFDNEDAVAGIRKIVEG